MFGTRSAGLEDVLNLLTKYHVGPEEVEGISDGGPNGGFIVALLNVQTTERLGWQLSLDGGGGGSQSQLAVVFPRLDLLSTVHHLHALM